MADTGAVRIEGLRELRRALAKLPEVKQGLRQDLLVVGRKVAADAQTAVPVKSGRAKASIRTGVSGNNAYIAGGKATVPYYGWLDFGSRTPNQGRPRSVGPWKATGRGPARGRFIYPAIERNSQLIEDAAVKALERVSGTKL